MKTIKSKVVTYPGKNKSNEDFILCHKLADNGFIAILADGMGGLSYGAEAAKIVSDSILSAVLDKIQECSPEDALRLAFDVANSVIYKKCRELKCKMGAAVTVVLIIDDSLYYAWQGNVRLYKMTNGALSLLTTDHTLVGTENIFLTRCVNGKGYRENVPVKHKKFEMGDKIYICSDGFYQDMDIIAYSQQNVDFSNANRVDDSSLIEIYKE